jgi:hypothetical protein
LYWGQYAAPGSKDAASVNSDEREGPLEDHGTKEKARLAAGRRGRWKKILHAVAFCTVVLPGGCKQPGCKENETVSGDFDDASPRMVCSGDTVEFSPQTVDSTKASEGAASAGGAGGATATVLGNTAAALRLTDSDQEPRALVHVDVFECGTASGENEADVENAELLASAETVQQGRCVTVSATRLDCLTNYDGRAFFSLRFAKSTEGTVCARKPRPNSTDKTEPTMIAARLQITQGGSGGSGGATGTTNAGAGGAT